MTTTTDTTDTTLTALEHIAFRLGGLDVQLRNATLYLHTTDHGDVATVERAAELLDGTTRDMTDNGLAWLRAEARYGPVTVQVFTNVTETPEAKRDRLAAELAALDAEIGASR